MRISIGSLFAAMLAVALCGCGDKGSPTTTTSSASGKTVDVLMTDDYTFEPKVVTIDKGDTIRWTNKGKVKHTATRATAEPKFDSGKIGNGATYTFTFTTTGSFDYVCTPHIAEGMVGTVIVK